MTLTVRFQGQARYVLDRSKTTAKKQPWMTLMLEKPSLLVDAVSVAAVANEELAVSAADTQYRSAKVAPVMDRCKRSCAAPGYRGLAPTAAVPPMPHSSPRKAATRFVAKAPVVPTINTAANGKLDLPWDQLPAEAAGVVLG